MRSIRKLYFQNAAGERFGLNGEKTVYAMNISGMGFTLSPTYADLERGFFISVSTESEPQGTVPFTLVFTSNPYQRYKALVDWLAAAGALTLVYNPTGTQEYCRDVAVNFLQKGELNAVGWLEVPCSFFCKTPWYMPSPAVLDLGTAGVDESKRYDYEYDGDLKYIAQLKNLFEKQWESILGNCDEFLYLGGNETGTHKMIAESYLGKQTIDMNTYGKSSGRSGNYSTNWQITGRELLDAAEVRMLDNRYALLFIRGEMPVMDEKYDLLNHPNVKYTPEKGGAPYVHGGTELAVANLSLSTVSTTETRFVNLSEIEYELLSDEEIEAELLTGGNTNEEHL